jgi:hypothetical protein
MSKIDRHSDLTSSREEQRILTRALGCGVEELVARFGSFNESLEPCVRRAFRRTAARLSGSSRLPERSSTVSFVTRFLERA